MRAVSLLLSLLLTAHALAEESKSVLNSTADKKVASEQYPLRYKFQPGEVIGWKVTHLSSVDTTIQGNTQTSKSRSVSTKLWRVTNVDKEGNITFTHSVDNVEMWQQLSDRPEVSYNSKTDSKPPPEYEQVSKTIGVILATVQVSATGQVLKREGDAPIITLGLGDIIMLLPPKPVAIGSRWHEPSELSATGSDGQIKRIKTRKSYTLEKVQTGVATISVRTEVLTPIDNARIQSQIVQQLTNGTIKFDVDNGRLISKQMDWDETVVGFNGAESQLKYLARINEELLATIPTSTKVPVQDKDVK
jgi:hypothetical protein